MAQYTYVGEDGGAHGGRGRSTYVIVVPSQASDSISFANEASMLVHRPNYTLIFQMRPNQILYNAGVGLRSCGIQDVRASGTIVSAI